MSSRLLHIISLLPLAGLLLLGGCAELETQRKQIADQERALAKLRDENKQFQDAYYKIKEQLDNQDTQSQKSLDQITRDLEQARTTRTLKEKELDDKLRSRTLEYEAFKKESLDQKVLLEAQAAQLQQNIQALTAERDATIARLKDAEDKLRAEQARSTDLDQQVAQLKSDVRATSEQLSGLRQDLADREAALKTEQDARGAAESKSQEAQTKLAELTQAQEKQAQALKDAQTRMAGFQKQLKESGAAQGELAQARQERDTLSKDNEALKAKLEEAQNRPAASSSPADNPDLKKQAAALEAALKPVKGVRVRLDGRGLRVIVPASLLFAENKTILAKNAGTVLGPLAKALGAANAGGVRIEGHTDNQPAQEPYADNWILGFARADRVREYLMKDGGIDGGKLSAVSRAEFEPLASNDTPEGRIQNRRIEIVLEPRSAE